VGAVHCDQVIWPGIRGLFGIRMAVAVALLLDRWFSLEVEDLRQNKNVCCCVVVSTLLAFLLCMFYVNCAPRVAECGCCVVVLCRATSISVVVGELRIQSCRTCTARLSSWCTTSYSKVVVRVDVTLSLEVPVHFRCVLVRAIRKYILCIPSVSDLEVILDKV
jgi:hypothetical protein